MNPSQVWACRDHVLAALRDEMSRRPDAADLGWIDRERQVVADAATAWAATNYARSVTAADVERIEGGAVGHVDYAEKLAWYVAELVTGACR